MPILDGCSAATQIREFVYKKGLVQPIIIGVSGHIEKDYINKGFKSGMNAMLSKPINIEIVKKLLQ